jgi:hypothetical protein
MAAVTLVYFRATPQEGRVLLEWETATQIDTVGFYVNRSLNQSFGYARVGNFIAAQGDPLTGATYSIIDEGLSNGTTYWYKLESIDTSQGSTTYDPPVSAIPGATKTSTPTPTPTRTVQSGGQLTVTGTATKTKTPVPGASRTPTRTLALATTQAIRTLSFSTPSVTPIDQGNETPASLPTTPVVLTNTLTIPISATATLIPLPAITLEFPTLTATPSSTTTPIPSLQDRIAWLSPGRMFMIGLVIIIWILLGSWFIYTLRRLE